MGGGIMTLDQTAYLLELAAGTLLICLVVSWCGPWFFRRFVCRERTPAELAERAGVIYRRAFVAWTERGKAQALPARRDLARRVAALNLEMAKLVEAYARLTPDEGRARRVADGKEDAP